VFACGRGGSKELGHGTRDNQRAPAGAELDRVLHSAAITSKEEVLIWGSVSFGQLGCGEREDRTAPAKLRRAPCALSDYDGVVRP
jgi:alpha-tubulin suppressor-like RCC1 family protein